MFAIKAVLVILCAVCSHAVPVAEKTKQNTLEAEPGFFKSCREDLGCFDNGPPFYHPVYRPVSLLPYIRFDTKFLLFDCGNVSNKVALEPNSESLQKSNFDRTLETKVIIHGYITKLKEGDWEYRMKDALMNFNSYNVIMVDWTDSNGPPYPQAVANARVVAAQLAKLIRFLEDEERIEARSVHLIGHSLGAHLAGWAGERLNNLGRVTGLDPAGPYFHKAEDVVRLDPSDAQFVDIIHTNGGTNMLDGLGLLDPIGHQDFYANGGVEQPGCPPRVVNTSNDINGTVLLRLSNSCNHARAPELFIDSIVNKGPCWFKATTCQYRKSCRNSKGVQVAEMGFHARRIPGIEPGSKFYLATKGNPPYCIHPRSMTVESSKPQHLDT